MAGSLSMDDKLLGEKMHYYCSSSEDENDDSEEGSKDVASEPTSDVHINTYNGRSTNTGPKGVINDWRRFKQLEQEKLNEQETERLQLMKKLSITCRSELDDEREKEKDEAFMAELENDDEDDKFIEMYRQKRIEELRHQLSTNLPKFGKVFTLDSTSFIEAIDKENPNTTVIVHVYESRFQACESMNKCLACLSQEYPHTKFCKIIASEANLSYQFSRTGVPALLIYKKGDLIGNFVGMMNQLGDDFFASDVESFLQEHGFLQYQEKSTIKTLQQTTDSDSDFDID